MEEIYIYPYGTSGKQLAWLIEYVDGRVAYGVDDALPNQSLALLHEQIRAKGVVYLALSKLNTTHQKQALIAKLKQYNLLYQEDMIQIYAKRALQKLQFECKQKGWHRPFIFMLADYACDKHFGLLDIELGKRGEKIIYFCSQEASYKRSLQKFDPNLHALFYCSYELSAFVDFGVIVATGLYDFHPKVPVVYLGHSLADYKSMPSSVLESLKPYLVCVAGESFLPKEELSCIKCGYLAYDLFESTTLSPNSPKDCVLFAPYDLEELKEARSLIEAVISHYKVILRYRYEWGSEHLEILGSLLERIVIDDSNPMQKEIYERSFVCVCSKTSMKHSFALLALSPSLIIPPKEPFAFRGAIEPELGLSLAGGGQDLLLLVHEIYQNRAMWRERIENYRQSQIYHFGYASAFLARVLSEQFGQGVGEEFGCAE